MSNLSKSKLVKIIAAIAALSSISAILTTVPKAEAVPLYPNDLVDGKTVRLQMEKTAPNGQPVTLNITQRYGLKNGGQFNTWVGDADNESLYKYLTNGSGINLQSNYGGYSINVPTLEIKPTVLNTYSSEFARYQDWNLEKVGGQYGDTYLFHWRTDTDTNLCLDIRGFGEGQQLNNQIPMIWYCDRNNTNQRIRVIKVGQNTSQPTTQTPPPTQYTTPSGNSLVNNNAMKPGTRIFSPSQCFRLDAQTDGNLVLYNVKANKPIWNSGTNGKSVKHTVFQNSQIIIYDPNNNPIWQTPAKTGGTRFTVQDDGNFVLYNAQNQALGATNTVQPCGNPTPPPAQNTPTQPVPNITDIPPNCNFREGCIFPPNKHVGVDYNNKGGTQVKAICDGKVIFAMTGDPGPNYREIMNRFTVVEHKNCGNYGTLYGYYGHINPTVEVNAQVVKGQVIGSVVDWPSNGSHLHFGLSTKQLNGGWGYEADGQQNGWIDPAVFGRNYGWK